MAAPWGAGIRGRSSVGRAGALQASGRRFDPDRLHQSWRWPVLAEGGFWREAGLGGRRGELGLVNLVWAPVGADKCGIFDIVDRFCR